MKFAALATLAALAAAQPYGKVTNLPGYSGNASMYSGYITVNATAGRQLFFWFVESFRNPATDDVVFWTNGGPGCSSLGGGMFSEHGPFRPQPDGTLQPWMYTWANNANMLYVEQPAGVGFSYSNTSSDYTVGDAQAAADIYTFLQGWLNAFPQYRSHNLWITGESYGGHYVPTISAKIVEENLAGQNPQINFAGFMVGNAWTDAFWDNTGSVEMWYWHNMISNDTRHGILNTCNMSDVGPLAALAPAVKNRELAAGRTVSKLGFRGHTTVNELGEVVPKTYKAMSCDDWTNQATAEMGNVDIYDLYDNTCTSSNSGKGKLATSHARLRQQMIRSGQASITANGNADIPDSNVPAGCAAVFDPCIDDYTGAYLNRADVQKAIHVNPAWIPGGSWVGCTDIVNYSYNDLLSSMLPVYQYLLTNFPQGRFLVYSGDVDGIVPFTGTRYWLDVLQSQMNLQVTTAFHPYNTPQQQVAGYAWSYTAPNTAQLHFASVRNAGHLVPYLQASRALQMFNTFLSGQNL